MFAALPMYERPENRDAHDRLWVLIRDGLRDRGLAAPDRLDRQTHHMDGWARPDLVLGQICNLPYRARFRDQVTLIGAPDTRLPDTPPGYYHSVFVVRARDRQANPDATPADYRDKRFALNEPLSNSGWDAPQSWAGRHGFSFTPTLVTGAHLQSVRAVATGRADIAAIDAATYRSFQRWEPVTHDLCILGRTGLTPGLTFTTRAGHDPAPFYAAISDAIAALSPDDQDLLGLYGIVDLPLSAYDIPLPAPPSLVTTAESV